MEQITQANVNNEQWQKLLDIQEDLISLRNNIRTLFEDELSLADDGTITLTVEEINDFLEENDIPKIDTEYEVSLTIKVEALVKAASESQAKKIIDETIDVIGRKDTDIEDWTIEDYDVTLR